MPPIQGFQNSFDSESELCDYVSDVVSNLDSLTTPDKVRIIQLVKSQLLSNKSTSIPNCLQSLLNDPRLCGLLQIAHIYSSISNNHSVLNSSHFMLIDSLNAMDVRVQDSTSLDTVNRQLILNDWFNPFNEILTSIDSSLLTQDSLLKEINCLDNEKLVWK